MIVELDIQDRKQSIDTIANVMNNEENLEATRLEALQTLKNFVQLVTKRPDNAQSYGLSLQDLGDYQDQMSKVLRDIMKDGEYSANRLEAARIMLDWA